MDKLDFIAIKDIRDGMKNINVMFIVLEVTAQTKTKENREVFSFKVADQTAMINCSIWDDPGKLLAAGDIVRLMKCYASMFRGCLTLYSGKSGELSRIGDFCMVFNEEVRMSEREVPAMKQNPVVPQILPTMNNGTNGNGRQNSNTANNPPASTNSSTDQKLPKGNSSNAKSYMRKPINKNK